MMPIKDNVWLYPTLDAKYNELTNQVYGEQSLKVILTGLCY